MGKTTDLIRLAGSLPEGVAKALRQHQIAKEVKGDRKHIEDELYAFGIRDAFDIHITDEEVQADLDYGRPEEDCQ